MEYLFDYINSTTGLAIELYYIRKSILSYHTDCANILRNDLPLWPTTSRTVNMSTPSVSEPNTSHLEIGIQDEPDQAPPAEEHDDAGDEDTHVKSCLKDAEELKLEGNDHFRMKRWDEALSAYRAGLGRLPKRKPRIAASSKGKAREDDPIDEVHDNTEEEPARSAGRDGPTDEAEQPALTELELECAKARSVMNANIGACYVKLGDHKEAVAACTEALLDDPQYVKALQRRASSNEQINTWSSLGSAQEDYNKLLAILPPSSPQLPEIRRSLAALKPRVEAAQKQETAEMIDKLKGLGNNILGKFGLSTENFQFTPNGQGGYSMNFVR